MKTAALLLIALASASAQPRTLPRDAARAQRAQRAEPKQTAAQRSTAARREFQRSQPCPSTKKKTGACPGYVIDHVVPLKRGGADAPENMQWQTVAEAKAKDKIE